MEVTIKNNPEALGEAAGKLAVKLICNVIIQNGQANIILATGTSQLETLKQLINADCIDWSKVVMFHLDEYIGLPESHPASFRKYLKERFLNKVTALKAYHLINGEAADPRSECERLNRLIKDYTIDVALVGIGENGHLAFNDPPADFDTNEPYLVVNLDGKCRNQQLAEGWFQSVNEVPAQAISMSVNQIMRSVNIVCSVPGDRKAQAIKDCFENPVNNFYPASILQQHTGCYCFLDKSSAALLQKSKRYINEPDE